MPFKAGHVNFSLSVAALLLFAFPGALLAFYDLPPQHPPEEYGNILIDRKSSENGMLPVYFSHWSHRMKYTCEVCHTELEFSMMANTTEMTEADHQGGKYCGACHDGSTAFAHAENCDKCHNGNIAAGRDGFKIFDKKPYPSMTYGNGIDWVQSLRRGLISPARYLREKPFGMPFEKTLLLEAEMSNIPPAIFPHRAHTDWMGCETCHPHVFNIKKKTTRHFTMAAILKGEFCGACHLNVAFPMNDCARCHPGVKEQ